MTWRRTRAGEERFPLAPLWTLAHPATLAEFSRRVDVHPTQVYRWRELGGLRVECADRAAVRLGLTPGEVWDEWPTNVEARSA